MKRIKSVILLFLVVAGCQRTNESGTSDTLHVVATTGMLYDAVINIVGNRMTAEVIMGPGVDPHLYKATQGDLSKLNKADLIVYNGIQLEGKMSEILAQLGRQKKVVAAASVIPDSLLLASADYEGSYDPHVWFDVKRWKHVVSAVEKSVAELDPENKVLYQSNGAAYLKKLDSLDQYVKNRLEEIPPTQRILITAHDAFGYFGDAYGMQVEGLQGMSTVAEFGLKDIANLIDLVIDNNIKAIFVETSVSEKSINAVVTGCREKGHQVSIGGSLFSDAMGEPGTEEGTYIGMFKSNINTIVEALK